MNSLVSVIIPIYNVETYLDRCLYSVRKQSYKNIEVILVNDGSTDRSFEIAKNYAEKDERFIIINKQNEGQGKARNVGITFAKGEYITFVDSDDYVNEHYINKMMELIEKYNADIVCVEPYKIWKDDKLPDFLEENQEIKVYNGIQAIKDMWYQKYIASGAGGKLFKKHVFDDVLFPEGVLYEDLGVIYKWFYQADKLVWTSAPLYYYYQRNDGTMNCSYNIRKWDRVKVSEELLQWTLRVCPELTDAAIARFFISNVQVLREIPYESKYDNEINLLKENIKKYRWNVIKDRNVKKMNRLIAMVSILDIRILKKLGKIYKIFWK